jgi:hypothetical protein
MQCLFKRACRAFLFIALFLGVQSVLLPIYFGLFLGEPLSTQQIEPIRNTKRPVQFNGSTFLRLASRDNFHLQDEFRIEIVFQLHEDNSVGSSFLFFLTFLKGSSTLLYKEGCVDPASPRGGGFSLNFTTANKLLFTIFNCRKSISLVGSTALQVRLTSSYSSFIIVQLSESDG